MIQIKKNDYVQPTEVRGEVVQAICDAFLFRSHVFNIYHPFSDGPGRRFGKYVIAPFHDGVFSMFGNDAHGYNESYNIRGVEMKRAFEELIKAGYHMFRVTEYGWSGYRLSKSPVPSQNWKNAEEVFSFDDKID
jgi:hypothetical protein